MGNSVIIDGDLYYNLVRSGSISLYTNRKTVNDLNVFPIPDGDTGDNMYMTIHSGVDSASGTKGKPISEVSSALSYGMLVGARGNSGVILSRIFSGISKGLSGIESASLYDFSKALKSGISESYSAVPNPVEGTILTVYRESVEYASSLISEETSLDVFFNNMKMGLEKSLERTPELLDVLREAGVVDSGGAGLYYILDGMISFLRGDTAGEVEHEEDKSHQSVDFSKFSKDSILEFGYCTEFLLRLQTSKTDVDSFDVNELIEWLNINGESVVAFCDGDIVKVHVHTFKPGDILNHCQKYGEYLTVKIENMTLQHNEAELKNNFSFRTSKPHKRVGTVSVASGEGIKNTFIELGCDYIVDGGQSMNPSAEDFLNAFKNVNADIILVFPNNGNIIMAAKQAASLYKDAEIRVVESRDIGQGYLAISMLDAGDYTADELVEQCLDNMSGCVTAGVSVATRDAVVNGISVKANDYIGFVGDTIKSTGNDRTKVVFDLCDSLNAANYDIVIVFKGKNVSETEADDTVGVLENKYRDSEIIFIDGGQPVYDYIIIID